MVKRVLFWTFALCGWVLAGYQFNTPAGPVHFYEGPVEKTLFDPGHPRKIVEWNEGKYILYPNGDEQVTPYFGTITTAFNPPKGWCPQDVNVFETKITYIICYDTQTTGGKTADRSELSSAHEHILIKGRALAEERWGKYPPRRGSRG